jgi:subtilisin family serine protease
MKPGKSMFYSVIFVLCFIFSFSQGSSAYTAGPQAQFSLNGNGHIFRENRLRDNFSKDKQREKYKQGELLVKFKPSISDSRRKQIHSKHGSQVLKEFKSIKVQHVKLKASLSVEEAITLYRTDPDVEYAEPNYVVSALNTPNDPMFSLLWNLHNTGQTGGTSGADIKAPEAWDLTTGSNDVVVAVIDTGVDYSHEDLAANVWINPGETTENWIDDDGNGYVDDVHGINALTGAGDPMDDFGHGTHVAGTIGAAGNNGIGVVGVNWRVKIMACKFLDSTGFGSTDGAIECLQYVKAMKDKGVNIVATNNSWRDEGYSQALYDAINVQQDILFMAAAGNSAANNDTYEIYPANFNLPNVISVAATDHNDAKAVFSDYGRRSVHIGAPGQDIVSLRAAGTDIYRNGRHFIPSGDPNAKYYIASGTSMAAPHVTGLAALIKSRTQA